MDLPSMVIKGILMLQHAHHWAEYFHKKLQVDTVGIKVGCISLPGSRQLSSFAS